MSQKITPWYDSLDIELAMAYVNKAAIEPPGVSQETMIREAVEVARDVASRFQDVVDAQMCLALALRNAGLAKEAEEKYSRVLELGKSPLLRAEALVGRAKCRLALGDINGVVADLRQAESLDPENVEVKQLSTRLGPYMNLLGQ